MNELPQKTPLPSDIDWIDERLVQIAELIEEGADPESFSEELDELLQTQMEARDEVAEATWEDSYRNGGVE